jgi:hydrogenase 3 maturation protease
VETDKNIPEESIYYPNGKSDLTELTEQLLNAKRLAILGIGSELMQDDSAGVEITQALEKKYGHDHPHIRIYTAFTSPENFTRDIADFSPDHLLLIDAADLGLKPGEFVELPVERITDFSLGTHKLSLVMMITFLKETVQPKFSVIAIQYKSIIFGQKITPELKKAVKKVTAFLTDILDRK